METLGHFCFRRGRAILAVTAILAVVAAVAGSSIFDRAQPFGFSDPGSESARAYDVLELQTGERAVPGALLLVRPRAPVDSPGGGREIRRVARRLAAIDGVSRVVQPKPGGRLVSADGRLALVEGFLAASVDDRSQVGGRVEEAFSGWRRVLPGGRAVAVQQLNRTTERDLRRIELYAAPVLLLISFFVFRGLVAAMLPLFVGGLSVLFTLAALRALSELMVIDLFALNVVTVLGLGLAIDYSLFMVSRYREELARAGPTREALGATLVPVGRMISFSAVIVAVAVAALVVFPQRFLYSTGIACALVAILNAAVVLIVLPAVLALLGGRVNALAPAALQRRAAAGPATSGRRARFVLAHPLPIAVVVGAAMVLAGLPFLRVELTRADARVLSEDHSARVVEETLQRRFPVDPSARMLVVLPSGTMNEAKTRAASRRLAGTPGVARVSRPEALGTATVIEADIEAEAYSDRAVKVVDRARSLPWGGPALVTGTSAELVDQRASLRDHLPEALIIILAVTLIALLLMTGSVVLPLLALACNALTVSVAFGVLVVVFQDRNLESLLSYTGVGALDSSVPILLFAVVFGLSTDYGVFLISRIIEAREAGADDTRAIELGLMRTSRSITAAALLFAVAMGAFVISELIFIKEVAVGIVVAVLVDATLVRSLLLPALMKLCGRYTWWNPRLSAGRRRVRA